MDYILWFLFAVSVIAAVILWRRLWYMGADTPTTLLTVYSTSGIDAGDRFHIDGTGYRVAAVISPTTLQIEVDEP